MTPRVAPSPLAGPSIPTLRNAFRFGSITFSPPRPPTTISPRAIRGTFVATALVAVFHKLTPSRMCSAGYINPTELFAPRFSGLPSADAAWRAYATPWYQKFDVTFSGFLINGSSGRMTTDAHLLYRWFSWDGGVCGWRQGWV